MEFLNILIGWIMKLCYSISFGNYILALFFFALVMQIILFPFGIKQQKSSVKLASIRPKEQAIRNKYRGRNDRVTQQKMNMEIQEMYKAEGYSPTAGCLPLLIQLPIIFALFGVVREPLTYTTNLDNSSAGESKYDINAFYNEAYEVIENHKDAYSERKEALQAKKEAGDTDASIDEEIKYCDDRISSLDSVFKTIFTHDDKENKDYVIKGGYGELKLVKFMQDDINTFIKDFADEDGKLDVKGTDVNLMLNKDASLDDLKNGSFAYRLIIKQDSVNKYDGAKKYDFNTMLSEKLDKKEIAELEKETDGYVNYANALPNFEFIAGTSTLDNPHYTKFNWLLIIPVLVFLSSFFSGEITRKFNVQAQAQTANGQPAPGSGGFMRWGMPLMSTYFSFTFPAAIGIYWIFRSITMVGQQFLLSKMYPAPVFSEQELKEAVSEEVKAKKRKKLVTIEVDEDDTSYDELAISEERAEKIRRRQEKLNRDSQKEENTSESEKGIDKPTLKDD